MTAGDSLRERLIDAGVDLVLTEGSASVGLRDIARRAGVSHGAPRRYFPTHHSLLSAIARRGFEDLRARFEAATATASTPRAQLDAFARVYVAYALDRRGMFELMFRHDLLNSEQQPPQAQAQAQAQPPRLRELTLPLAGRFAALVAQCRGEAPAQAGEHEVTAALLWSGLHGIAQLWAWGSLPLVLGGPDPDDDAPKDPRLDRLVAALLDAHLGPVQA
ncbi:TetR/AcrR family transcriptional regulator [Streptomyces ficellus]|uniref:TetR/AcrR family transcriptional regulator n=1 Tax=Streptomyces ficellus TaxID=1977088 RepID=A0A6I6FIE5_9ACTN|nr:TetR/AcrR family transcriptional regulator [Streptomyces ficellus]QGV77258.1 TetR/AcrR family transcriptional regulator [Streptomyces ficellus]